MTSESKTPLHDNVKKFQDLTEESQRRRRIADNKGQLRLHVAIFPSVAALSHAGADDCLVTRIRAHYSKMLSKDFSQLTGGLFKQILTEFRKLAIVDWKVEKTGKPYTVKEVFEQIRLNGIPDMVIDKISFSIPYTQFNNYTLQNEDFHKEWTFKPYTFRKGIWNRLKAINFPAQKLYYDYVMQKNALLDDLSDATKRRWRDTILMNAPHDELTNQEIRAIWGGLRFALLLKEARGRFDLMDMGEWR